LSYNNKLPENSVLDVLKHPDTFKKIVCKCSGVTFENRQASLKRLDSVSTLFLDPEPTNPYDSQAVKVMAIIGDSCEQLGFVPVPLNKQVFPLLMAGMSFKVDILSISEPKTEKDFYGLKIEIDSDGGV
jgi:hypothetical protein